MPRRVLPLQVKSTARRLRREMTNAERLLWTGLKAHRVDGWGFRRQVPIGPFIVDFVCHAARLIVEVDGATHSTDAERERDQRRDAWLAAAGYETLRIYNDEVYRNREGVLETIRLRLAERTSPSLPSPPKGGGIKGLSSAHGSEEALHFAAQGF
jgi:very-short-patch-repair endonuclease